MSYKEFKKDIIEDIQITNNNIKKSENEILDESTEKRYKKLKKVLSKNIPDYKIDHDHVEDFIKLLKKDKKSTKGKIVYILPTGKKGVSLIEADDEQKIKKLIYEYIKQEGTIKI